MVKNQVVDGDISINPNGEVDYLKILNNLFLPV